MSSNRFAWSTLKPHHSLPIAFLCLLSCGQGIAQGPGRAVSPVLHESSHRAEAKPAVARPQNDHTLNIVYVGDSITRGGQNPQPPPETCTKALERAIHGSKIYMSNQGRSGDTTVDFLPSTQTDFPPVEQAARQLEQAHPGTLIFSVMLGTNDSASSGPNGSPVSPQTYASNLNQIFSRLLRDFPRSMIIVQRPTWYSPNTYNSADYQAKGLQRLQSYFPVIRSVVEAFAVSNPNHVYMGDTSAFRYFAAHYRTSFIPQAGHRGVFYLHPNTQGAVVLGNFWAAAIETALHAHSREHD